MKGTSQRLPPLVAAAVVSIIMFCGAGVAAILGVMPAEGRTPALAAPGAAPAAAPAQAGSADDPPPLTPVLDPAPREPRPEQQIAKQPAAPAAPACAECGTVLAVTPVVIQEQPSGLGAVGGAVLGGVVGHQLGNGRGQDAMTAVGAVGGALAGNRLEQQQRQRTHYEVSLRMEDGSRRSLKLASAPGVANGDRVRVENGRLLPSY